MQSAASAVNKQQSREVINSAVIPITWRAGEKEPTVPRNETNLENLLTVLPAE